MKDHLFGICRSFARWARLFSASVAHQNFNFRWENVYFLFMGPLGNLRLALLVASNVFGMTFSHFRIDFGIIS